MQTSFQPSARERRSRRSSGMGPLLPAGRHGRVGVHQELNVRDCSAFWGQADLFLTCAQAASSCGFYSGRCRGGYEFSSLPFWRSPPLRAAARQSASALRFSRPRNFPCWPSQMLSLIILKSKTDGPFLWIPPCIAVVPLSN